MASKPKTGMGLPPDVTAPVEASTVEAEREVPQGAAPHSPPPGPTQGELDEALEDNLNLKAENARLQGQIEEILQRMARIERLREGKPAYTPDPQGVDRVAAGEEPLFDEEGSFGTIWGDSEVAYVQGGHYFGPDKRYVRSDPIAARGSPRAFKPQLVGLVVKPRIREAA